MSALYANALDRPPDQAGLSGWVEALERGGSRSEVVVAFSESPEHVALAAPRINDGIVSA